MEPSPSSNPIASTPIAPDKDAVLIERWVRTCDQLAKPVTAVIRGTTVVIPDFGVELIFTPDGKIRVQVIIGHVWSGSIPGSSATSGAGVFPVDKVVVVRMAPLCPNFDAIGIYIEGYCDRCFIALWRNPSPGAIAVRIPTAAPTKPIGGTMYDVVAHKLGFQRASDAAASADAAAVWQMARGTPYDALVLAHWRGDR